MFFVCQQLTAVRGEDQQVHAWTVSAIICILKLLGNRPLIVFTFVKICENMKLLRTESALYRMLEHHRITELHHGQRVKWTLRGSHLLILLDGSIFLVYSNKKYIYSQLHVCPQLLCTSRLASVCSSDSRLPLSVFTVDLDFKSVN